MDAGKDRKEKWIRDISAMYLAKAVCSSASARTGTQWRYMWR